jgi:hypothetical protein
MAQSNDATAEIPATPSKPVAEKSAKKISTIPSTPATVPPICTPAKLPVYIEDWGRLSQLTQSDFEIFSKVEFWADRKRTTTSVSGGGLLLGVGLSTLGIAARLDSGHWTKTSKELVAGGVAVVLVSVFVNWAFSPDRDDLLTVMNHWNLRHPDRPLAP